MPQRHRAAARKAKPAARRPAKATPRPRQNQGRPENAGAARLRHEFFGWQCRLRQIAVRLAGGRPSPGMRPRALGHDGAEIAEVTVLLVKSDPDHSTRQFRHQVQKTQDPVERYDKVLEILAAAYFQHPEEFSDSLMALFGPRSAVADRLLREGRCLLAFEQYGQGYRLPCRVEALAPSHAFYQATYWHNHLFNPAMPPDPRVLAFLPDWSRAEAIKSET